MTETDEAWRQVHDDLTQLGLKLQAHLRATGAAQEVTATEIQQALRQVASAIEGGLSGLGQAAQDQEVREDAAKVAHSLGDALAASLTQVGQEVADAIKGWQGRRNGA